MGLRALLDPWLGEAIPFLLATLAVLMVQIRAGRNAALATVLGCIAWTLLPGAAPAASWVHRLIFLLAAGATVLLLEHVLRSGSDAVNLEEGEAHDPLRWLRASIALSLILPGAFFLSIAWFGHGQAQEQAQERLARTARVAEEHAARVIETNGVIARQLLQQLGHDGDDAIRARRRELHRMLAEVAGPLRQVQSVWVWDRYGRPLVSSLFEEVPAALDVSDRDYFLQCLTKLDGWYVSRPALSRSTGEPFFNLSHCRQAADGSFAGVISVSLRPEYFADFYAGLASAEPGLAVTLLREDGTILARHPAPGREDSRLAPHSQTLALMRQGVAQGRFEGKSTVDGVRRSVLLHRLEHYPLYIATAMERSSALAAWQTQLAVLAAVTFPASLALAYLTSLALRRARRETEALRRLRAESEQRMRAEQALRQAQKLEALGQLTGGVAHDFNNLLMVVNTNVHLLGRQHPQLQQSKQLGAIQRAVSSGARLTRQLLAFSRRQALRPETLRLPELLPSLAELLRTSVGSGVKLELRLDPATRPVTVDPAELEVALLNLAINARDAMPGGGRLTIEVRNAPAAAGEAAGREAEPGVEIAVTDTGEGIPDELRERVFEPFFTTKEPGRGTGLGLSQVYGFCTQAGGSVRIESEPGQGTTVRLRLPASPAPLACRAAETVAAPPAAPLRARVLLVEDNPDLAEATQALLRSFGCEVEHAGDATAAQQRLGEPARRFDLLLSDILMPGGLSGIGLAGRVRELCPGLPILLMTGYTKELDRAVEQGFEVLPKPLEAQTLEQALRRALADAEDRAPGRS
ncbi:ATP-binding protein [Caldimonas tepidiphila]|uniref:ATP-binding protein n=1 Tax=Caldimonas tepidiphila TaxID=2315841 RepID=UPI00147388DA|nr:ATP-binding protein [Caldimonas tepidiphila]